jgi:hypothetical protein
MKLGSRGKTTLAFLHLLISALFIGCAVRPEEKSVEEMLEDMNISEATYVSLVACRQSEIYTAVGLHHLDLDHSTVLVPHWMDQAIDANPPQVVADCIAEQGFERLDRLAQEPQAQEENSFAIHVLFSLTVFA